MIKELENKTHTFIEGTNNEYTITTEGEVWSHKSNKFIITKYDDDKNCITAQIHIPNKKRKIKIHLEVARHFIPNPNNYKFVRFIDNNKYNCNVENLYWSEFIIDIKIKPEKILKEVKNIDDIEKKENELFVNFNHEIYNHYLISNYGRIFNSKSGRLFDYKPIHIFINGNKENDYNINLIVFNHFEYNNIYLDICKKISENEIFITLNDENFLHYKISNYGRIFNSKIGLFLSNKHTYVLTSGKYNYTLKIYNFLYENFNFENIYYNKPTPISNDEEWKEIIDSNKKYWLSNYGRVLSYSMFKPNILKPLLNNDGYYYYNLSNRNKVLIHQLVPLYFISEKLINTVINHKDGDKLNNYYKNLEYISQEDNCLHAINHLGKNWISKEVIQLDENKIIINEFNSLSDANRYMSSHKRNTKISSIAHIFQQYNILKKYKGFHWIFKDDYNKLAI